MKPRTYLDIALVVLGILAFSLGKCSGKNDGQFQERERFLKQENRRIQARSDSLLKAVHNTETLLKAAVNKVSPAKVSYRTRVDSIPVLQAPPDYPPQYALVDTAAMYRAFHAADRVIAVQDTVIQIQKVVIGQLKEVITAKDSLIRNLNKSVALNVQRRKSAGREGFLKGAAATLFLGTIWVAGR